MNAIPTQAEYEDREARLYFKQLEAIEQAPLSERKEGQASFFDALQDPAHIAERVSWLFNGSYGWHSYKISRQIAANKRMNRVAALSQMVAALDHNCPVVFARQAYLKLRPDQQEAVNQAVQSEIEEFLAEEEANVPA